MFLEHFFSSAFFLAAQSVSLPLPQGSTDSVRTVEPLSACFLALAIFCCLVDPETLPIAHCLNILQQQVAGILHLHIILDRSYFWTRPD